MCRTLTHSRKLCGGSNDALAVSPTPRSFHSAVVCGKRVIAGTFARERVRESVKGVLARGIGDDIGREIYREKEKKERKRAMTTK